VFGDPASGPTPPVPPPVPFHNGLRGPFGKPLFLFLASSQVFAADGWLATSPSDCPPPPLSGISSFCSGASGSGSRSFFSALFFFRCRRIVQTPCSVFRPCFFVGKYDFFPHPSLSPTPCDLAVGSFFHTACWKNPETVLTH